MSGITQVYLHYNPGGARSGLRGVCHELHGWTHLPWRQTGMRKEDERGLRAYR